MELVRQAAVLGPVSGPATRPDWADLATQWRIDPLTVALALLVAVAYVRARIRAGRQGIAWPRHRDVVFGVGIALAVWFSSGELQARSGQVEWAWMAQQIALLMVIPLIVLAAQPLLLAREACGGEAKLLRIVRSRPVRVVGNPLIGPALVPVVFLILLYGGVGQAAVAHAPVGWTVHVGLLLIGTLIALPLVDATQPRTSLAVGMALGIGIFELLLDAFPGIAMRLASHPVIPFFAAGEPAWVGDWLYQQHQAGGLLWIVLEALDLPFLILVAVTWLRVDAAEAARVDAELDERDARRRADARATGERAPATERPWFLDDPQLRERYRY